MKMRRKVRCDNGDGVNRGAWTAEEDKILINYVQLHGEGKWRELSKRAGLKRRGKSCRLRWLNYLKPDIKRGNISSDEEDLIIRLHNLLGNRWSLIARRLPGRTDNEIKNYWNTYLRKKLEQEQEHNHNKLHTHTKNIPTKSSQGSKNSLPSIIDPTKSPHTMIIKPKSMGSTKVIMPTSVPNDSANTMNLITMSWDNDNPSMSTPQHDHYHCSASFIKDFDISDLFMPYEDSCFNGSAYVEKPQHFGDEACRLDDFMGKAWYENWKIDDYFHLEHDVGFSLF